MTQAELNLSESQIVFSLRTRRTTMWAPSEHM